MKKTATFVISIAIVLCSAQNVVAIQNTITVYYDAEIGQINKKVFGNNFKGRDPWTLGSVPNFAISDYGSGVWDPEGKKPVRKVMHLATEAGVTIVRYAVGGYWNWHNSIGQDREHLLFGLDEFMKTTEEIGAEAAIIVSALIGNEEEAADLVEYLNAPRDGSNINGGIDWAEERAKNGHPDPYLFKYFEIENEPYTAHIGLSSQEYVNIYLEYYEAMKAVDPSIKIGFVLPPSLWHSWFQYGEVLSQITNKLDYAILHRYFNSIWGDSAFMVSPNDRFKIMLSMPMLTLEAEIPEYLKRLRETSGKDIPLAISEYNSWWSISQHRSLGAALLNAELLKIFMKPEHNILMANQWQMSNGLFGMVRSVDNFTTHDYQYPIEYIKRPNYYVYELYNRHFGDVLIETDVQSEFYDISDYQFYPEVLEKYSLEKYFNLSPSPSTKIPYLSVNASKSNDGTKIYLMVINKKMDEPLSALIELKNFLPSETVSAWVLRGPHVTATNEEREDNVIVVHEEFTIQSNPFEFIFDPHSVTAIEIEKGEFAVAIDIKPDSDKNRINLKSKGVISVAILTTEDFDATTVDPLSVTFGPDEAIEAKGIGDIMDTDGDDDLDFVLDFNTQMTGITCGDTEAGLTGTTFEGQAIEGLDSINTVGCK
jgi:alpha-L-arabinofuranosidase